MARKTITAYRIELRQLDRSIKKTLRQLKALKNINASQVLSSKLYISRISLNGKLRQLQNRRMTVQGHIKLYDSKVKLSNRTKAKTSSDVIPSKPWAWEQ